MWNFSCDNGHVDNSPLQLKIRILPADNCDVKELLAELIDVGLIVDEGESLFIPTLTDHQKPNKRWWKTCDKEGCAVPDGASSTPNNVGPTPASAPAKVAQSCTKLGKSVQSFTSTDVDVDGDSDKITTSRHGTADAVPRHDVEEVLEIGRAHV